jgi:hypothetical protein
VAGIGDGINYGVFGVSGSGSGVFGGSTSGAGVWGDSQTFDGVHGITHNPNNNTSGVAGFGDGGNHGVFGLSTSGSGVAGAALPTQVCPASAVPAPVSTAPVIPAQVYGATARLSTVFTAIPATLTKTPAAWRASATALTMASWASLPEEQALLDSALMVTRSMAIQTMEWRRL